MAMGLTIALAGLALFLGAFNLARCSIILGEAESAYQAFLARFDRAERKVDDLRVRLERHEAQWRDAEDCPSCREVAEALRAAANHIESRDESST